MLVQVQRGNEPSKSHSHHRYYPQSNWHAEVQFVVRNAEPEVSGQHTDLTLRGLHI